VIWIFAALLWAGILTMRVESRWALTAFDTALFTLAAVAIARRRLAVSLHPIGVLLAAVALWGVMQAATGITIDVQKTLESSVHWAANCAAFCLALWLVRDRTMRRRFLTAHMIFALLVAVGAVIWLFTQGALGPFIYRNQFAAFIEPSLGLAIAAAIGDRKRTVLWVVIAAALFAAVIAGGSRAGSAICLALLVVLPCVAYFRELISARGLARVMVLGGAAVCALVAVVGWQTIWDRLQEPNPYSLRADLNRSSLEMVRERPAAGFGLGTWAEAYPKYARFDDGNFVNQAHDDWAQWAVEGGVPLFVAMLAMVAIVSGGAVRSLWGIGLMAVFLHAVVDYPFEQRPALAAYFFGLMGVVAGEDWS
jgi:O-antigen ligase